MASLDQVSAEDKVRLKAFIESGLKVLQEVDDLKGGLRDTAKTIAEEMDVKPSLLMKALSAAFKANIEGQKADLDDVEMILEVTGRR
jgi:hypothetical protein